MKAEHLAMLEALNIRQEAWENATDRQRYICMTWGVPLEVATEVDRQLTEAMSRALDAATFFGIPGADADRPPTPSEVRAALLGQRGATPDPTPTREGAPSIPDVPHSGEQVQPTPQGRRMAWLAIHGELVGVVERKLNAARDFLPYAVEESAMVRTLATEWAALQLLKALRDMKAPVVPVDDTLNQPTLEEAVEDEPPERRFYCKRCDFYTDHVSTAHDGLAARGLLRGKP